MWVGSQFADVVILKQALPTALGPKTWRDEVLLSPWWWVFQTPNAQEPNMNTIDGESGVPVMTNKRDLKRWEVLMVHDVPKEKPKLVGALQLSKRKSSEQQPDAPAGSKYRKC